MRILQLSTYDGNAGGAEQVAMNLHRGFLDAGDDATLAVGFRRTDEPGVVVIDNERARGVRGTLERGVARAASRLPWPLAGPVGLARLLAQPLRLLDLVRGHEDFHMPASRRLLELAARPPDLVHAHNLHGGYFDLRQLAPVSAAVPTFVTLHDMWMLTGHCAYSMGCDRWRSGCGSCPDLTIYPAVARDATRRNLARKRDIYRRCTLHVASPSQWLLSKAQSSILREAAVEWRLIPYGVDLDVFNPSGRAAARERLGIPANALVLLYAANAGSPFKDYATVSEATRRISDACRDRNLVFLVLGGRGEASVDGCRRFVPFVTDRRVLADYYRAADVFLHAAREDNFPNTVLESQACGTPVVATAIGGIPEQIAAGATGAVVPPADPRAMANATIELTRDLARLGSMRAAASTRAREIYGLERHVSTYRSWFADVLESRSGEVERRSRGRAIGP
jgi:glycosyltransferase involved in cell wall biosynthesis